MTRQKAKRQTFPIKNIFSKKKTITFPTISNGKKMPHRHSISILTEIKKIVFICHKKTLMNIKTYDLKFEIIIKLSVLFFVENKCSM